MHLPLSLSTTAGLHVCTTPSFVIADTHKLEQDVSSFQKFQRECESEWSACFASSVENESGALIKRGERMFSRNRDDKIDP